MNDQPREIQSAVIADSPNFTVWTTTEPDGEVMYHIELAGATMHLDEVEWAEFKELMAEVIKL